MSVRAKQAVAVLAGLLVAGVMVFLGIWQQASYQESTRDVSAERAAQPPVVLADAVAPDGSITDVFGRRVNATGEYLPEHQVLVGDEPPLRVATAFKMADGRVVAVVRGAVASPGTPPPAPVGVVDLEGIFLAPDFNAEQMADGADLGSMRVQALAQEWPSPLIAGYVTLPGAESEAQGLAPAKVILPEAEGSPTHLGYALQWWVFAAGAIAFGLYVARGFAKDAEASKAN